MLAEIRKEIVPILIVIVVLAVWSILQLTGDTVPDDVQTLTAMVVSFYFGSRTGASAATRALNGAAKQISELSRVEVSDG